MSYSRILHVSCVALALVFMAWLVVDHWNQIKLLNVTLRYDFLIGSLGVLVVLFFLDALGWHLILRSMGYQLDPARIVMIWMVSSLSRYIPGGVWSYFSRASMARDAGIKWTCCSISMYLETLLLTASSCAVGVPALLYISGLPVRVVDSVIVIVVLGLLLHPKVIKLGKYIPGRFGKVFEAMRLPSIRHTIMLYLYYVTFWCLFGLTFIGFVSAICEVPMDLWLPIGSSLALGFFVGFVMIFIPGGIGIRESVIYALCLAVFSPSEAVLIAISSRLWIMAGEFVSVLLAVVFFQRTRNVIDFKT